MTSRFHGLLLVVSLFFLIACGPITDLNYRRSGQFCIDAVSVNGQAVELQNESTHVVLDLSGSKLVITPLWYIGGTQIICLLNPARENFVLAHYEIISPHLAGQKISYSYEKQGELPKYWASDGKGGRKSLIFPLVITGTTKIGLVSQARDVPVQPLKFLLTLQSEGKSFKVEILAHRKIEAN